MIKKILCVCFCFLMLCGCDEDYDTQVYGSDSQTTKATMVKDEDFEPMTDIGKDYKLFDNSRVVNAYKTGDDSGLTDLEKDIFNEAKKILDEIKKTATTHYEIELAVHDYIVESSTYDKQAISAMENPQENSENPYGILINKTGICLGYTTTFQLFMDMAEIPCVTIYAKDEADDEHAWNQVQIDGEWCYVDCTWDDPVPDYDGRGAFHQFFNVTEEYMWDTGHRWDKDMCEESDSYQSSYYVMGAASVSSRDDIKDVLKQAVKDEKADCSVKLSGGYESFPDFITAGGKEFFAYDSIEYNGDEYVMYRVF